MNGAMSTIAKGHPANPATEVIRHTKVKHFVI
jgi:hypothetical protein